MTNSVAWYLMALVCVVMAGVSGWQLAIDGPLAWAVVAAVSAFGLIGAIAGSSEGRRAVKNTFRWLWELATWIPWP